MTHSHLAWTRCSISWIKMNAKPLMVELFGGLRLRAEDRTVERFPTRKTASLLARLAMQPTRIHRREELMELFWPEMELESARHNLRQTLHTLRQVLRNCGFGQKCILNSDNDGIWFEPGSVSTDVAEFEAAIGSAETAEEDQKAHHLIRAVEIYSGELLSDCYDDWVFAERRRLDTAYIWALRSAHELLAGFSDPLLAEQFAHRLVAADPLNEESHLAVIRLHAAAGEPRAIQLQSVELQRVLHEAELGCPSPQTISTIAELLAQAAEHERMRKSVRLEGFRGKTVLVRRPISIGFAAVTVILALAGVLMRTPAASRTDAAAGNESAIDVSLRGLAALRTTGFSSGTSEQQEAAHRRHALQCVDLGEQAWSAWYGPEEPLWLKRIEMAHDDFRAALTWLTDHDSERAVALSGALTRFWYLRGFRREGYQALVDALERPGPRSEVRARALIGCFFLSPTHDALEESRCREALSIYREHSNRWGEAHALRHLGFLASERSNRDEARKLYNEALADFTQIRDDRGRALTLLCIALIPSDERRVKECLVESEQYATASLTLFRKVGNPWGISFALDHLSALAVRDGNFAAGEFLIEQATGVDSGAAFPAERDRIARFHLALSAQKNDRAALAAIKYALRLSRDQGSAVDAAAWLHQFALHEVSKHGEPNAEELLRYCAASVEEDRSLGIQRFDASSVETAVQRLKRELPQPTFEAILRQASQSTWEQKVDRALESTTLKGL